jgi:hypothetical protein
MANLEKKKLEKKEMDQNELLRLIAEEMGEIEKESVPEKPKLVRKPRKTKEVKETKPVEVKVKVDPSEAETEPETDLETTEEKAEPKLKENIPVQPQPAVSEPTPSTGIKFDEDAIANKVVAMLLEKGVGVSAPHGNAPTPLKPKKPKVARATSAKPKASSGPNESVFPQTYPPQPASFSWM